jgi:G3E family GTPase
MNGDLLDAIFRILDRAERPNSLLVETTGVADPLPVALTFLRSEFQDLIRLDSILALADAENFSPDHFNSRAARSQLRHADIILLNKCDLVTPARLQIVESAIREIADDAHIIRTIRARVPLSLIWSTGLFQAERYAGSSAPASVDGHDSSHSHLEEDEFMSVSFESVRPFVLDKFQDFLNQLPKSVFRAKGILWMEDKEPRYVFHLTGRRFTLEETAWTDTRKNRLVLIGQRLAEGTIRDQLSACLVESIPL